MLPLAWLVVHGFANDLGPDPIATITHTTGDWTLRFLLVTLGVSPVRRLSGHFAWLIRFRRMLGLFAFFYGSLHLTTYIWLFSSFDVHSMIADVYKRRFITAGMLGWLLMVPLALTSTAWAVRKIGGKRWQLLHRVIYISAIAGVIHYWWLVKPGVRTPLTVTAILAVLLLARLLWMIIKSRYSPAARP
ncbi:MAG: protein-methionine-sulfoxide reductase heme-binding subunit MsrQ [Candidatus Acidiferrales bacterium]|jgi:sulfoxide reductase heme-binding subunit YedZ